MSNSNGRISGPVSLHADVYPVLGVSKTGTYYDIGYINSNSHGRTNKWSKHKPIRYAQQGTLTDAQFKGSFADNNQGIYYGLQVATEAGRLGQLHDALWNYLPPRPGTDWCRLTDWDGYDHNALPTLNGLYDGENPVRYNIDRSFHVNIAYDYRGVNTTGVDIGEMLPATVAEDIGDYYPCILIGDYARSLYSTAANPSTNTGQPVVTPLRRNGAWDTGFYAVLTGLPGLKDGVTLKCTAFLIRAPYATGIFDFRQQWVNVAQTVNAYNAFSIPGAVALNLPFEYYTRFATPRVYRATRTTGTSAWPNINSGFTVYWDWPNGAPDQSGTVRVSITSPGIGSKEVPYNAGSGDGRPVLNISSAIFKWTDIGLSPNPGGSEPTQVRGSIIFFTDEGSGESQSFTLTLE